MRNEAEEIGRVFNLQRMSLHDGPGIRTVIFLKGCNLRCFWCHNPESVRPGADIEFFANNCIGCGMCEGVCPSHCHRIDRQLGQHVFDRTNCARCGKCAEACPAGALVRVGETRAAGEVVREALRDRPFFEQSGGGVTISGGEPMIQPAFTHALLSLSRQEGLNTAMETALCYPFSLLEEVLGLIDYLFVDFKHPDSFEHERFVGRPNGQIKENIRRLSEENISFTLRIPVIPGVNDSREVFSQFADFFDSLKNPPRVELMPYHAFGLGKQVALDQDTRRTQSLKAPGREELIALSQVLRIPVEFRQGPKKIVVNGGSICEI